MSRATRFYRRKSLTRIPRRDLAAAQEKPALSRNLRLRTFGPHLLVQFSYDPAFPLAFLRLMKPRVYRCKLQVGFHEIGPPLHERLKSVLCFFEIPVRSFKSAHLELSRRGIWTKCESVLDVGDSALNIAIMTKDPA
jgi:hypothetical protein